MKHLTTDELDQLNFDNSDVTEMTVNTVNKSFLIRCAGADLTTDDDDVRLNNISILVDGFESVQARIFIDDEFKTVDALDQAFFLTEVCELSHEDGKTMISGFSTQEGSWADFTLTGGSFAINVEAQD
ncbi:MAG: hypothetical protein H7318_18100 [Oligoflexus sp.]|nr:hypothetical protein [Oligoflexus sp.]